MLYVTYRASQVSHLATMNHSLQNMIIIVTDNVLFTGKEFTTNTNNMYLYCKTESILNLPQNLT